MSGFSTAIAAALKAARDLKAEPILYSDGNGTIPLTAAVGSTDFRQTSRDGVSEIQRTTDFLIDPADLCRGGSRIDPDAGHTITRTETGERFEAMPVGGEPCWRWSDAGQSQLRIHTQKIGDT